MKYRLLKTNVEELLEEFEKEHPYLLKNGYNIEEDLYYEREIEKVKVKYSKEDRKYILKKLKNQKVDNYNWLVKTLAGRAIMVAIMAIIVSLDFGDGNKNATFDIISLMFLFGLAVSMVRILNKYSKYYTAIGRMISVFEFIKHLESKSVAKND
ncbi:MAG: hypothetical protein ABS949_10910 [Solibacillus sp.]